MFSLFLILAHGTILLKDIPIISLYCLNHYGYTNESDGPDLVNMLEVPKNAQQNTAICPEAFIGHF